MALISIQFILFCAFLIVVYYLVPGKLQNLCLLAANLVFLSFYHAARLTVLFLGLSILTTWAAALVIGRLNTLQPGRTGRKRAVFVLTVLLNLAFLFVFKFANSAIFALNGLGIVDHAPVSFAAPLGISFYTLQLLSYLIDVYNGGQQPQRNLLKYALFGSYFPLLTSGPIVRYSELGPQFDHRRTFQYRNVTFGAQRMMWGFFKKLVISERAAVMVNTVFGDYPVYAGSYILGAVLLFAIQLYTDFSGCMDIVIGLSEALGLTVPENFLTPFYSTSETEFWRRWHINLGTWFTDYVFYPLQKTALFGAIRDWSKKKLGKKRGRKVPMYLAMAVLWFSVGFWHGGLWKYIVGSGVIHFVYIFLGQELAPAGSRINRILHIREDSLSHQLFRRVRTLLMVCSGFLFFRAASFHTALKMLRALLFVSDPTFFTVQGLLSLGLDGYDLTVLILAVLLLIYVEHVQQTGSVRDRIAGQHIAVRWLVYIGLFFLVVIFGMYGAEYNAASFIYANF